MDLKIYLGIDLTIEFGNTDVVVASTVAQPLDQALHALAHPVRRQVVEQLAARPMPVGELAEQFDMRLPSFIQHLGILEQAGLIASTKVGRVRTCRLQHKRLSIVDDWLAQQREQWTRRLDQLDAFLQQQKFDE